MDTIFNAAFGYDIDLQNNPDNPYFIKSESVFKEIDEFGLPHFLGSTVIFLL
jgi:hypothetical protein